MTPQEARTIVNQVTEHFIERFEDIDAQSPRNELVKARRLLRTEGLAFENQFNKEVSIEDTRTTDRGLFIGAVLGMVGTLLMVSFIGGV